MTRYGDDVHHLVSSLVRLRSSDRLHNNAALRLIDRYQGRARARMLRLSRQRVFRRVDTLVSTQTLDPVYVSLWRAS